MKFKYARIATLTFISQLIVETGCSRKMQQMTDTYFGLRVTDYEKTCLAKRGC
jgi:hypothetical protein